MAVRVSQIDGSLPNLALMRLASWHREQGDEVFFFSGEAAVERKWFEPQYKRVYASSIFKFSAPLLARFREQWPEAIVGGTGTGEAITVEDLIGDYAGLDYSLQPHFRASIGFTQRGCRMSCKFCVVPKKEGKNRSVTSIYDIWRGEPHPRWLHLLDNDFFGQSEWRERIAEIRDGDFEVCFSQGINVRLVTDEVAEALASIKYRSTKFNRPQLYTAWDNFGDEAVFFRGVDTLERHGVLAKHLMAYMLLGFDKAETWERIFHRFNRMNDRGIFPYPMVFEPVRNGLDLQRLKAFQRWVIRGLYRQGVKFEDYDRTAQRLGRVPEQADLFERPSEPNPCPVGGITTNTGANNAGIYHTRDGSPRFARRVQKDRPLGPDAQIAADEAAGPHDNGGCPQRGSHSSYGIP